MAVAVSSPLLTLLFTRQALVRWLQSERIASSDPLTAGNPFGYAVGLDNSGCNTAPLPARTVELVNVTAVHAQAVGRTGGIGPREQLTRTLHNQFVSMARLDSPSRSVQRREK
jgi:uncharacterized protein affecting Mg2+/Co2+ transport